MSQALLTVRQLRVYYQGDKPLFSRYPPVQIKAVDGIQLDLAAGETLGIVGESGCGKSTLARALVGLVPVTEGAILLGGRDGRDLAGQDAAGWRATRNDIQMVFQDPLASLNPRMSIGENIAEPLVNLFPDMDAAQRRQRVGQALQRVGLRPEHASRYPHEFSGGQNQRVGIARALVVEPKILICDEAVSALDVTVRAQILALLRQLQAELNLGIIFISHDLAVVQQICHRVMVMYLGKVMEQGPAQPLLQQPHHPYTRALLSAVPIPDPKRERNRQRILLSGEPPSPAHPPDGCVFRGRCPMAEDLCGRQMPVMRRLRNGCYGACHFIGDGVPPLHETPPQEL